MKSKVIKQTFGTIEKVIEYSKLDFCYTYDKDEEGNDRMTIVLMEPEVCSMTTESMSASSAEENK